MLTFVYTSSGRLCKCLVNIHKIYTLGGGGGFPYFFAYTDELMVGIVM